MKRLFSVFEDRFGLKAMGFAIAVYVVIKVAYSLGFVNAYWQRVLDQSLITAIGAIGLSLIYGFAGQFSLGHAAFYGFGAYTAGVIGKVWGQGNYMWFLLSVIAGAMMAVLMSYVIGIPVLRLRSDYLGIATLGFGIIVKVLLNNSDRLWPVLGGARGVTGVPQLAGFDLVFWVLFGVVLLARNIIASSYGRSWVAVREDELAADMMGINTAKAKQLAFTLGCMLAGLAGGLYAYRYPYLHPSSFDVMKSLDFLLIVVLGGLGSLSGTVLTSILFVFLLEVLRMVLGQAFVDWRGVIYALVLITTILLRPQGLFAGKEVSWLFGNVQKVKEGKARAPAGD